MDSHDFGEYLFYVKGDIMTEDPFNQKKLPFRPSVIRPEDYERWAFNHYRAALQLKEGGNPEDISAIEALEETGDYHVKKAVEIRMQNM